jgi:hypothetical protein
MPRTFLRPETQIKTLDTFDDQVAAGSTLETTTWNMEQFLQGVISQLNRFLNTSVSGNNWYADLTAPTTFEGGAARGIDEANQDLHDFEHKRVLRSVANLTDIGPLGSVQHVVLTLAQLPANTTAAIGSVTTLGTVAAYNSTFDTATLDEVTGSTAIAPKNICEIVDASTRDPVLDSSGRRIWALFQTESNTDGSTMTGTTPNRAQLSFVVVNSTGDDLQLVAAADMNGKSINYSSVERTYMLNLNEQDFLRGAIVDVPSGSTVTRQVAYDNQGTTPVDVTTASYLDLEGAGLVWQIRDDAEQIIFGITENSGTSATTVLIGTDTDVFDVNAVTNDFLNGASFDTGAAGTTINIGVTANQIDSGGALTVASGGAGDLKLDGAAYLVFTDQYQAGSGYATDLVLSDSSAEWDAYETEFGEVSLLNAIVQASGNDNRHRATSVVSSAIPADTLIEGPNGPGSANTTADLLDYRNVTFVDDVEIFINGQLMLNGADAAANNDVYPSATATPDQQYGCFYAEFALKAAPGNADVIQMFITGALT